MGFYGTLGVGVVSMIAQSSKLGIISDNIANVNTVGYKESVAGFQDLILNEGAVGYSAQGTRVNTLSRISKQGILQNTNSTTDLAISGNGFFAVTSPNSTELFFTRAGSFTQDNTGSLKNAAGYFLQGWPLDATGAANTAALQTVNIQQVSGAIVATGLISIGANLDADADVYPGAGSSAALDPLDSLNANNTAVDIIVPNGVNHIQRGDVFNISTGSGLTYDYTYGGFTVGRNVTDSTPAGNGDNGQGVVSSPITLGLDPFQSVGSGSGDVIITLPTTSGLSTGDLITLAGSTAVGGITAGELTGNFLITVLNGTQVQITTTGSDPAVGGTAGGGAAVNFASRPYTGAIFDASNATDRFFADTGTANLRPESLSFTITNATSGTVTFSYTSGSPNVILGQFNNLTTLASAINETSGLTARVVNGRLYVGAEDGNEAVTFANTQASSTLGPPAQYGLDWIGELGLSDIGSGTNRFSTLNSLVNNINDSTGLKAVIANPLGQPSLEITVNDPLDTITFSDRPIPPPVTLPALGYTTTAGSNIVDITATVAGLQVGDVITLSGLAGPLTYNGIPDTALNGSFVVQAIDTVAGTISIAAPVAAASVTAGSFGVGGEILTALSNNGSLLGQLGIAPSLNGAAFPSANPVPSAGPFGPAYNPADPLTNMAGGTIAAQFSRSITVYDDQGDTHDLVIGFIKTGVNQWAAEVYAADSSDVTSANGDGLLASGNINFNGDGTLASIDAGLSAPLTIAWTGGAGASTITVEWGTAGPEFGTAGTTTFGDNDGMSQYGGGYNTRFIEQDGATIGDLTKITIDAEGNVLANYSNGDTQTLYRIPLAMFTANEGLEQLNNNVFRATTESGVYNLVAANTNGAGVVFSSRLESSNADLATQLTDMIIAQRSYQFGSRLVSVTDELLQDLNQMGAR